MKDRACSEAGNDRTREWRQYPGLDAKSTYFPFRLPTGCFHFVDFFTSCERDAPLSTHVDFLVSGWTGCMACPSDYRHHLFNSHESRRQFSLFSIELFLRNIGRRPCDAHLRTFTEPTD